MNGHTWGDKSCRDPNAYHRGNILLNSIVSLVAGERYMRNGLVAVMGIHFWTDIVWHVIWPLIGRGF